MIDRLSNGLRCGPHKSMEVKYDFGSTVISRIK